MTTPFDPRKFFSGDTTPPVKGPASTGFNPAEFFSSTGTGLPASQEVGSSPALEGMMKAGENLIDAGLDIFRDPTGTFRGVMEGLQSLVQLPGQVIQHPIDTTKSFIIDGIFKPLILYPMELATDTDIFGDGNLTPEERFERGKEVAANFGGLFIGGAIGKGMSSFTKEAQLLRQVNARNLTELVTAVEKLPADRLLQASSLANNLNNVNTLHRVLVRGLGEGIVGGGSTGFMLGDTPEERFSNAVNYGVAGAVLGTFFETLHVPSEGRTRRTITDVLNARTAEMGLSVLRDHLTPIQLSRVAEDLVAGIPYDKVILDHLPGISDKQVGEPLQTIVLDSVKQPHPEVLNSPFVAWHQKADGTYRIIIDKRIESLAALRDTWATKDKSIRNKNPALDEASKPLVFYTGTPITFDELDPTKAGENNLFTAKGEGIYLTEATDIAEGYARASRDIPDQIPADTWSKYFNELDAAMRKVLTKKLGTGEITVDFHKVMKDMLDEAPDAMLIGENSLSYLYSLFFPDDGYNLEFKNNVGKIRSDPAIVQLITKFEKEQNAVTHGPQIRPVYLDVRNPLDLNTLIKPEDWEKFLQTGYQKLIRERRLNPNAVDFNSFKLLYERQLGLDAYDFASLTWENMYETIKGLDYHKDLLIKWKDVNPVMQENGYDSLTHVGGGRTNHEAHRVVIIFDPKKQTIRKWVPESASFTTQQLADFKQTGFLPGMTVLYKGKEMRFIEAKNLKRKAGTPDVMRLELQDLTNGRIKLYKPEDVSMPDMLSYKTREKIQLTSFHDKDLLEKYLTTEVRKVLDAPDNEMNPYPEIVIPLKNDEKLKIVYSRSRQDFTLYYDKGPDWSQGYLATADNVKQIISGLEDTLPEVQFENFAPKFKPFEKQYELKAKEVLYSEILDTHKALQKALANLSDEERAIYHYNVALSEAFRENELVYDAAENAAVKGITIMSDGGVIRLYDTKTRNLIGEATSSEEVAKLIQNAQTSALETTFDVGKDRFNNPPINPGNKFTASPLGDRSKRSTRFTQFVDKFKWRMHNFINMREVFLTADSLFGTDSYNKIFQPLQVSVLKYLAARNPWLHELGDLVARQELSSADRQTISQLLERRSADELINEGYKKGRKMSPHEIESGQKIAKLLEKDKTGLDRAFQFRRIRDQLIADGVAEKKMPKRLDAALSKMGIVMNPEDIEVANLLDLAESFKPDEVQVGAITALARAILDQTPDEATFIKNNNIRPELVQLANDLRTYTTKLGKAFGITEPEQLFAYLPHIRRFDNGMFEKSMLYREMKPREQEFFRELRTGEISDYFSDPFDVLAKYVSIATKQEHMDAALDVARKAVDDAAEVVGKRSGGIAAEQFKQIGTSYINRVLGGLNPHDQLVMAGLLDAASTMSPKAQEKARWSLIELFLRTAEFSAQGFKPLAGVRDATSFISTYFTHYGSERLTNGMRLLHEIMEHKDKYKELGKIPGLKSSQFLSASDVEAREAGKDIYNLRRGVTDFLDKWEDRGFKWSFQPNVYEIAHMFTYVEHMDHIGKNTVKFFSNQIDRKAFDKALSLDMYRPEIVAEFDRLLEKDPQQAARYLSKAAAEEIVGYYGMANQPMFMRTRMGKLFGQFGQWPIWMINTTASKLANASLTSAAKFGGRMAAVSAIFAAAGSATGLNLNNWRTDPLANVYLLSPASDLILWTMLSANNYEPTAKFAQEQLARYVDFSQPRKIWLPVPFQVYDVLEAGKRLLEGHPPHIVFWKLIGGSVKSEEYPRPDLF